jgi:hypothetical protein
MPKRNGKPVGGAIDRLLPLIFALATAALPRQRPLRSACWPAAAGHKPSSRIAADS